MQQTIDISLLGRNEIAREGLRRILTGEDFTVKMSGCDQSAFQMDDMIPGDSDRSHIIIVDNGADHEGVEHCRALSQRFPHARLVLLADDFEFDEVALAFGSGIDGYIIKEISCEPLIESLKLIALGEKVLPSQLASSLCNHLSIAVNDDWRSNIMSVSLSEREVEILSCLMMGSANKVISRQLSISEATVKVHVKAILRKLHVSNRTQAAIWAVKHGLEAKLNAQTESAADLANGDVQDETLPILDYAA